MGPLREALARWGWIPLAAFFLLAYSVESRASETTYYRYSGCTSGGAPGVEFCAAHSPNPDILYYSASFAQATIDGWASAFVWSGGCSFNGYAVPWTVESGGFYARPRWLAGATCTTQLSSYYAQTRIAAVTVPDCEGVHTCIEPAPPVACPAADAPVPGGRRFWDGGTFASAPSCMCPAGEDCSSGDACAVVTTGVGACVGDMCVSTMKYTGGGCSVAPGTAETEAPEPPNPDVTCIVIAGNVHCWHKDGDPDCQAVNGEQWCFSDVAIQPIVTLDSQVLALPADNAVTDDLGDPVAPDSTIERNESGAAETVNHYNSSTVTNNNVTGAAGNPSQSGTPGTGTVPGTGDGPGGEGEGEGGGTASGGDTCGAMPVCDGDPVGCAVLAQAWRQRCVDELTGDDIATLAGESSGTTLESLAGDLVEGDGTGLGVQSLFNDFFSSQGGDWWARGTSCVTDPVITLPASFGLSSLTIELSRWCSVLAMLGQLILALAWLQALRILVGAV